VGRLVGCYTAQQEHDQGDGDRVDHESTILPGPGRVPALPKTGS
jgi:hypothetical protein